MPHDVQPILAELIALYSPGNSMHAANAAKRSIGVVPPFGRCYKEPLGWGYLSCAELRGANFNI